MKIKITHELLNSLRQKAEAATEGPWNRQGLASLLRYAQKHDGPWNEDEYIDCCLPLPEDKDAEFIVAANPAVVLALIEEIEQLRSIKNELAEELSCVLQHTDLSGWKLGEQIEKSATDLLRKISKTS